MIRRFFVPLSPYALADITPLMIEEWFHDIGEHSQSQANKSLGMLRTMFGRARDWRVFTGENPASRRRSKRTVPACSAAPPRPRRHSRHRSGLPHVGKSGTSGRDENGALSGAVHLSAALIPC